MEILVSIFSVKIFLIGCGVSLEENILDISVSFKFSNFLVSTLFKLFQSEDKHIHIHSFDEHSIH
jgi:hypothetical protein